MKVYLIACVVMLGIQAVAEAEGLEPIQHVEVAAADQPQGDKSFFESHSKEDIQRMIEIEAGLHQELKAEMGGSSSEGGAG